MFYFGIPYNPIMNIFGFAQNPYQNCFVNPYFNIFAQNFYNTNFANNTSVFSNKREHTTYNSAKADLLLKNAQEGLPSREPVPPLCAKYVKEAIVKSGLGAYIAGNGEQAKYMLRNNLNFYEVPINSENDFKTLPNGTIFVYDANDTVKYADGTTQIISSDGHVGFKKDNNTMLSDRVEELPVSTRAYAFIPV